MDLSVVIATRDRPESLSRTLEHLAPPPEGVSWEVVVCDNGTVGGIAAVLRACADRLPVVPCEEARQGKSRALNRALDVARGNILVFTDDDITPETTWLADFWRASLDWPDHVVFGGSIEPAFPDETPSWLRTHDWAGMWFGRFQPDRPAGPLPASMVPYPANMAIRAKALQGLCFDEAIDVQAEPPLGFEMALLRRLSAENGAAVYVPSARVAHEVRRDQLETPWLLRRCHQAGRGFPHWRPDETSARLWGRPRWLWREWFEASLLEGLAVVRSSRVRFEARARRRFLAGQLQEYGRLSREQGP